MLDQVRRYIDTQNLVPSNASILVGVSGGVDSMVLLHLLRALSYSVVCAHVNYCMRGEASDGDQEFVKDYCRRHQIPCFVHRVSEAFSSKATSQSFQEQARDERYGFFQRIAVEQNLEYVAVAHHLDDQVETVLMHLMRGSGIEGLAGMRAARPLKKGANIMLIRPLLGVTRSQVKTYAEEMEISWREDASNTSIRYTRNKIRHGMLKTLRDSFGEGALQNIARSAGYLRGYIEASIQPALDEKFAEIALPDALLDLQKLRNEHPTWQNRIILEAIQQWLPGSVSSSNHAEAIRGLLEAQVGRRVVMGDATVWRDRTVLRFVSSENQQTPEDQFVSYLISPENQVTFAGGKLEISFKEASTIEELKGADDLLLADASKVQFPLILRRWKQGDHFVPFGMTGRKKVSDFLTDIKIPPHKRSEVWVLLSDNKIIWVVGYRAGASVKIGGTTQKVMQCRWVRR